MSERAQVEAEGVDEAAEKPREIQAPPHPKEGRIARVWAGSAISTIGMRTLGVAYPLLALAQTGSPTAAGWAGFFLTVPVLVFYIPGGLLVDRISPRRIILFAECGRWLTVLTVLVAMLSVGPSLTFLMVAAAVEGTMWVLYTLAEAALLQSLVLLRPGLMQRALAKREAVSHLASIAGRPLGGYLFGVGRYVPFLMNAVLFAVSFRLFFGLRHESIRRSAGSSILRELPGGFRALMDQPFLGGSIMLMTFTNLLAHALIMVFVAGSHGMPSVEIGLVLAASGLGGAVGSTVAYFYHPRRSVLLNHSWIWAAALFLAALGAWLGARSIFFAVAFFTTGFGGALTNVAIKCAEVSIVDPGTLARVVGVSRLFSQGAICLAAPLGGLLVTWRGVTGGTVVLLTVMLLAAALLTGTRLGKWFAPPLPDLPRGVLQVKQSSQSGELSSGPGQVTGKRRLLRGDRPPGETRSGRELAR
ncbi:MFS transporter [Nonomuraea sp. SYSU D8015]|uniref:MFS transporter n=1 Tax=Nonomuraea sp. SYSU D8015 TaxID=2593644 RepID=UPI0016606779|nr:MFS transporter [Nonomuraea sp. SYSU D8015]